MIQAGKWIARGLSLLGAVIVGTAALPLTIAAIERVVGGVAAVSSEDGLTRIMSPIVIAIALLAAPLVAASLVGAWRTLGSRGRRQAATPISGVLAMGGVALLHTPGPATDWIYWLLPALAVPLLIVGTGIAAGGWLLGWTGDRLSPSATALRTLTAIVAAALVTLPLVVGVFLGQAAAAEAQVELPETQRVRLLGIASEHWGGPLQRLTYLELAVTLERHSVLCGTNYTVESFTLFGFRLHRLQVDECGITPRSS
jgi:hypothetical protein